MKLIVVISYISSFCFVQFVKFFCCSYFLYLLILYVQCFDYYVAKGLFFSLFSIFDGSCTLSDTFFSLAKFSFMILLEIFYRLYPPPASSLLLPPPALCPPPPRLLKLRNQPASGSPGLGLQACTTAKVFVSKNPS